METLKPPKAYSAGHEPEESLRYQRTPSIIGREGEILRRVTGRPRWKGTLEIGGLASASALTRKRQRRTAGCRCSFNTIYELTFG